MNWYDGLTLT